VKKRVGKRINIGLDAEFDSSCMALTENISEGGIYVKIACTEPASIIKPGTQLKLIIELPSGKLLDLACKKIWSNRNTSNSLIEHIGVEIINPPDEYKYFYHRLRLQNFKWQ
jgi:hypothetical protein